MKDDFPAVATSPEMPVLHSKMLAQLPVFCFVDYFQSPLSLNLTSLSRFTWVSKSPPSDPWISCLPESAIASPFHSRDPYPKSPVSNTDKTPRECNCKFGTCGMSHRLKRTLQETLPTYRGSVNKGNGNERTRDSTCGPVLFRIPGPSLRTKAEDPSQPDAHMATLIS